MQPSSTPFSNAHDACAIRGEQNFMHDDHKSLREAFEKYLNSTKKDVQFSMVHFMLSFHTQHFYSFISFIKIQEK